MKKIRQIILFCAVLTATACTPKEKSIGIQLYTLRDDIKTLGIEKVLENVADIGYNAIELAGYDNGLIYGMPPMEFKQMANDKGLEIKSSHVVRFLSDKPEQDIAYWTKAIKVHAEMGVGYLITSTLPWWGKEDYTREDADKVVDYFNQIGRIATEYGIRFGFHNHNHVFNILVEGKSLYSIMLEELNPDDVFMEMDVYWVKEARECPIDYLKKYPRRYPILHIKDDDVIGGSGEINFERIFKAAYKQGMEMFFVEIENYKNSPLQDAKESFDYLNNASFVKQ